MAVHLATNRLRTEAFGAGSVGGGGAAPPGGLFVGESGGGGEVTGA